MCILIAKSFIRLLLCHAEHAYVIVNAQEFNNDEWCVFSATSDIEPICRIKHNLDLKKSNVLDRLAIARM